MMKLTRPPLCLLCFILCSVAAHVLLKSAGVNALGKAGFITSWVANPYLWATFFFYALCFVCWVATLKVWPLSAAYPWTALTYVLTPLTAYMLWGEHISASYVLGMLCIFAGILITTQASAR